MFPYQNLLMPHDKIKIYSLVPLGYLHFYLVSWFVKIQKFLCIDKLIFMCNFPNLLLDMKGSQYQK